MENDLIKDLINESLFVKRIAIFSLIVSICNVFVFYWIFKLVNS